MMEEVLHALGIQAGMAVQISLNMRVNILGTGIKIYNEYLYFGADTMIVRYPLIDGELKPLDNIEVVAKGFYGK